MNIFGIAFSPSDVWLLRIAGALSVIVIGSVVRRATIRFIAKRKSHAQNIADCLTPFMDAIANIHLGEHNHIFIMRSFFRDQEEAIAIFQSKLPAKTALRLKDPWNQYKTYYELKAKDHVHAQFATISEPELNALHDQLTKLMKAIKKT